MKIYQLFSYKIWRQTKWLSAEFRRKKKYKMFFQFEAGYVLLSLACWKCIALYRELHMQPAVNTKKKWAPACHRLSAQSPSYWLLIRARLRCLHLKKASSLTFDRFYFTDKHHCEGTRGCKIEQKRTTYSVIHCLSYGKNWLPKILNFHNRLVYTTNFFFGPIQCCSVK